MSESEKLKAYVKKIAELKEDLQDARKLYVDCKNKLDEAAKIIELTKDYLGGPCDCEDVGCIGCNIYNLTKDYLNNALELLD